MEPDLQEATTRIVAAYLRGNTLPVEDLAVLIVQVSRTLHRLAYPVEDAAPAPTPAVPFKQSVTPGHLVCLECGAKAKMMKRHLQAAHGMTPEEYRGKWSLSRNYPIVAPNYTKLRAEMAISGGFGRRKDLNVVLFKNGAK